MTAIQSKEKFAANSHFGGMDGDQGNEARGSVYQGDKPEDRKIAEHVRKVLRSRAPEAKKRKRKGSVLDAYKRYLKKRYLDTGLSAVRLLEEIRGIGYRGSADTVRRYLRELDEEERLSRKRRSEGLQCREVHRITILRTIGNVH